MRVVLESIEGPHRGQKILLHAGQAAKVGRTEWADFAFPRDGKMSGMHFALECGPSTCRIRDLGSTNGTTVNGNQVTEAALNDKDKIVAGESCFSVSIEDAVPMLPPAPSSPTSQPVLQPRTDLRTTMAGGPLQPADQPGSSPDAETPVTHAEPAGPRVGVPAFQQNPFRVVLNVVGGPDAPRKILLQTGQATSVGRTESRRSCLNFRSAVIGIAFYGAMAAITSVGSAIWGAATAPLSTEIV